MTSRLAGDRDNKMVAGQDALALRPTVLLALALKDANPEQKQRLQRFWAARSPSRRKRHACRRKVNLESCGVFEKAELIVDRSREKAEALIAEIEDLPIRPAAVLHRDGSGSRITTGPPEEKDPVFVTLEQHRPLFSLVFLC